MNDTKRPGSPMPSPAAGLAALESGFTVLPEGVLCSEADILHKLRAVEAAKLPLAAKLRLITQAELDPFITGSPIAPDFGLLIDIADGVTELTISKIDTRLTAEQLHDEIDFNRLATTELVRIPEPRLIFSAHALSRFGSPEARELAAQLFAYGKRITRFQGVTVTWDQSIDRRVWTTNIDTVNFIQRLADAKLLDAASIRTAMEVGIGGGGISKTILQRCPKLEEHLATDISSFALMCAKRNLLPILRSGQKLSLYLAKGLRSIRAQVDLFVVNPPYIPTLAGPSSADPYRGTGLIREVLELGARFLNPENPEASICLGMSSLADSDLAQYVRLYPRWDIQQLGPGLEVPLKIYQVNENQAWIKMLIEKHGLKRCPERAETDGFEYWHTISVLRLKPKD